MACPARFQQGKSPCGQLCGKGSAAIANNLRFVNTFGGTFEGTTEKSREFNHLQIFSKGMSVQSVSNRNVHNSRYHEVFVVRNVITLTGT